MAFTALISASGTLVANTASNITFGNNVNNAPIRYGYVWVTQTSGTATIFVRTDGTVATVGGDLCFVVDNGTSLLIANMLPLWYQSSNVIPASAAGANAYLVTSGNGPSEVNPMGTSPYGLMVNPGTSVSLISTGTPTFTVTGTG